VIGIIQKVKNCCFLQKCKIIFQNPLVKTFLILPKLIVQDFFENQSMLVKNLGLQVRRNLYK